MNTVKHHQPTSKEKIGSYETLITFSDQKLLDLWENEMSGQISDGQWENSRNTEWIWNAATALGNETKVETVAFGPMKKSFPFNKDLKEIVGERATEESGFESLKETSNAWNEINDAIKNSTYSTELSKIRSKYLDAKKKAKQRGIDQIEKKLKSIGFDNQYSFASRLEIEIKGADRPLRFTVKPNSLTESGLVKIEVDSYMKKRIPEIVYRVDINTIESFIKKTTEYITMLIR